MCVCSAGLELFEFELLLLFEGLEELVLFLFELVFVVEAVLSFFDSHDSFDWTELVKNFHLDVENITQLRQYLEMAEQSGLIKAEQSATSCRYFSIGNKKEVVDPSHLDNTVFRLMNKNVVKQNLEEN